MQKPLARLVFWMRVYAISSAALLILVPTLAWLGIVRSTSCSEVLYGAIQQMDEMGKLVTWLIMIPSYAIIAYGIARLADFYKYIDTAQRFSLGVAMSLTRFGYCLLIGSAIFPFSRMAAIVYSKMDLGGNSLWIHFPLLQVVLGVMFGLSFVMVGVLMREANRVVEENASFV